jgi:hypothetical protein
MNKRLTKKSLTLLLTLAMLASLFCGLTITASAADGTTWDGSTYSFSLLDPMSPNSVANPYIIDTAGKLAKLANDVYTGTQYDSTYFRQTADLNLNGANYDWLPIGGRRGEGAGYVPNGYYFAGIYDGNGKEIAGMAVDSGAVITSGVYANFAGWGLFGCLSGTVKDLTVKGSVTVTGAGEYIGGIVGYSRGNIKNCVSEVVVTATGSSNVGGIAGAMETSGNNSPIYIFRSSATGNVTGSKRVGGLVGGMYNTAAGATVVDECSYTAGKVETTSTAWKSFIGGLVGYSRGYIGNSYTYGIEMKGTNSGGSTMGGLVGLVQGVSPTGSVFNCYAYVTTWTLCDNARDNAFVGSVDNTHSVNLWNCFWIDGTISQTTSGEWGTWINTQEIDTSKLAESTTILSTSLSPNGNYILTQYLNNVITTTSGNPSTGAWQRIGTYPTLTNAGTGFGTTSLSSVSDVFGGGGSPSTTPDGSGVIYLNGIGGNDGTTAPQRP